MYDFVWVHRRCSEELDHQEDQDIPTEVHRPNRGRAVYRIDPRMDGKELRLDPRPISRTDHTGSSLSRTTRQSQTDGQARSNLGRAEQGTGRDFSLLARLEHTDRIDELIDPFDQFMHFDHPNLSKAQILHLSEDLGRLWSKMVQETDKTEQTDRPATVLLLAAVQPAEGSFWIKFLSLNSLFSLELVFDCLGESYPSNSLLNYAIEVGNIKGTSATLVQPNVPSVLLSGVHIQTNPVEGNPILGSFKWYQSHSSGTMSSHEEQNRPENSVAGLSNLQMRALNDSFSNLINTGLEQIHQRLDELQVHRPNQGRAVYRIDPRMDGMELRLDPRPISRTDRTGSSLSRTTRQSQTDGQARSNLGRAEQGTGRDFSLLARLERTDRIDELIDPFDQFMHFDHPNPSKAQILHLSEDLGRLWSKMVQETDKTEQTDRPATVLLLAAVQPAEGSFWIKFLSLNSLFSLELVFDCLVGLVSHIKQPVRDLPWRTCESYQAPLKSGISREHPQPLCDPTFHQFSFPEFISKRIQSRAIRS
ncbi:hypothetical protein IGI04_039154 [Brassica rapa subsp. trilocularis]|uniref:Uncharacterized protein n=1 Tax=Brassica rapa subsp. trilocularis TaxID=1813537 RepID=A0ABQ7KJ33_BRACM|nr:hypothetical protein IGI04_039154 [Brassica rapa subsp. trilocularis]